MKFRAARHTADLQKTIEFYCGILDLEILNEFHNHDGYDGVIIGIRDSDWQLEFTISGTKPEHQPDADDLLVFYSESEAEYRHIKENFRLHNIKETQSKNPYWTQNGITFIDPDGFRIVIAKNISNG